MTIFFLPLSELMIVKLFWLNFIIIRNLDFLKHEYHSRLINRTEILAC